MATWAAPGLEVFLKTKPAGRLHSSHVFRLPANHRTTKYRPLLARDSSMTGYFKSTQEKL
jgi:hypothetical protein